MQKTESIKLPCGYEEDFTSPVDDDLQCLICQLPLREPVLTRCGHRFCRQCLDKHMGSQESQKQDLSCPVDREELDRQKDIFPDKATERKILSFTIKCPSDGCDWTDELRGKEDHLSSCSFKLVSCTNENCQVTIPRKELEEHVTNSCQWRIVVCDHCNESYPKCLIQDHVDKCDKKPVECPNKCGEIIVQEEIASHTNNCPLSMVSCPYAQIGCDAKVQREQLESHLDSSARRHLDLACVKLNANEEQFKEATRKLESKIEALEKQFKEKFQFFDRKMQLTTNLSTKLDNEILKLKEESQPFVWKIEYFREILRDAKWGRTTVISSGNFFTGPNGYRLILDMYPNGDGAGKNTHISVFLTILRGKYDAVLPWPFRKTVTFTLIDQEENLMHRDNYVRRLAYDQRNSDVFARPVTDCNTEFGFPTFISHQELRSRRFIKDDTLFLQVQTGPPSWCCNTN